MELRNTYKLNEGFSLVEIVVVLGIFTVILAFGMNINLSAFTSGTLQGEQSKIVSILGRARSHAMANMFQSTQGHGVCYNAGNYVIFRGRSTCLPLDSTKDEYIPTYTTGMTFTFPVIDIVFEPLTGNLTPPFSGTLVGCAANEQKVSIDYQGKTANICINNEGRINW